MLRARAPIGLCAVAVVVAACKVRDASRLRDANAAPASAAASAELEWPECPDLPADVGGADWEASTSEDRGPPTGRCDESGTATCAPSRETAPFSDATRTGSPCSVAKDLKASSPVLVAARNSGLAPAAIVKTACGPVGVYHGIKNLTLDLPPTKAEILPPITKDFYITPDDPADPTSSYLYWGAATVCADGGAGADCRESASESSFMRPASEHVDASYTTLALDRTVHDCALKMNCGGEAFVVEESTSILNPEKKACCEGTARCSQPRAD